MGLSLSLVLAVGGGQTEDIERKIRGDLKKAKDEAAKIEGVTYVDTAFLRDLLPNASFTDKTSVQRSDAPSKMASTRRPFFCTGGLPA